MMTGIKRVGLLGGSFNPPHQGHVYISEKSIDLLGLDEVWWLVAKQNPLKEKTNMQSFDVRYSSSIAIAKNNPKIIVSDFESTQESYYIFDILIKITKQNPNKKFVWLMGADNLAQFKKWYRWQDILNNIPIAVLNRKIDEDIEYKITDFKQFEIKDNFKNLFDLPPPVWCYLDIKPNLESSTKIREDQQSK